MISSSVNCLMDHWHNKNIFAIIHSQGHVMCRGQCQTRGKFDNFEHYIVHLKCFKLSKII